MHVHCLVRTCNGVDEGIKGPHTAKGRYGKGSTHSPAQPRSMAKGPAKRKYPHVHSPAKGSREGPAKRRYGNGSTCTAREGRVKGLHTHRPREGKGQHTKGRHGKGSTHQGKVLGMVKGQHTKEGMVKVPGTGSTH